MHILVLTMVFGMPAAALIWFLTSLGLYLSARRKNKRAPGSVDEETMRESRNSLIGSAVVAALLVGGLIAIIVLLYTAVAFM